MDTNRELWVDIPASELFGNDRKILIPYFKGITIYFERKSHASGTINKVSNGELVRSLKVKNGDHAFRVTLDLVKVLPQVEADHEPWRRLARTLDWPLTWIRYVTPGEEVRFGKGYRLVKGKKKGECVFLTESLGLDEKVALHRHWIDQRGWVYYMLVHREANPRWEDFQHALIKFVQEITYPPLLGKITFEKAVEFMKEETLKRGWPYA